MDGMKVNELDLLRTFYSSWKDFHKLGPGAKNSLEHKMAAQLLVDASEAIEKFRTPAPDTAISDFRAMQTQVAAIEPKNGRVIPAFYETQHKR